METNKVKLIIREGKTLVTRGQGVGVNGEKVQIFSYKMKSSEDLMYSTVTIVNIKYCILEIC